MKLLSLPVRAGLLISARADLTILQSRGDQCSTWDAARNGMPDYNDLPDLPLRMTVKIPGQGEITNTTTAIKQDPIPEDQFVIPKDFTEVPTPESSKQSPSPAGKKP